MIMSVLDNIVAEITPVGRAAVSGIRVSGNGSKQIIEKIFNTKIESARKACFIEHELDQIVAIYYKAPHSYTGEDVCEIFCHGNPSIVNNIINAILKGSKTRMANPGEFTKRAYLNGKMDLLQAESVVELINSSTNMALKYRNKMLKGKLSEVLKEIKKDLLDIAVHLELEIDFEEENYDFDRSSCVNVVDQSLKKVKGLLDSCSKFEFLSKDIKVVIVGAANAGKSSLFNKLIEHERSIVHHLPGTTRDYIDAEVFIDGLNVTFVDTAGMREGIGSEVEKQGIGKIDELINESMLIVEISENDDYVFGSRKNSIKIRNKIDLYPPKKKVKDVVYVSALKGDGIDVLKQEIGSILKKNIGIIDERQDFYILTKRQKGIITLLKDELNKLDQAVSLKQPIDAVSFIARRSISIIDELLGETKATDEVLDVLFSRFCIGK